MSKKKKIFKLSRSIRSLIDVNNNLIEIINIHENQKKTQSMLAEAKINEFRQRCNDYIDKSNNEKREIVKQLNAERILLDKSDKQLNIAEKELSRKEKIISDQSAIIDFLKAELGCGEKDINLRVSK